MNVDSEEIREFQRLVLEMLFGQYHVVPDVVLPAGEDGVGITRMVHSLAPGPEGTHTAVVDAHLVPLSATLSSGAIASSFIVAFNASAQSVHVVSNGPLSEQVLAQAARFKQETALRVHLIDGQTLSRWVRKHESTLDGYPRRLLDKLLQQREYRRDDTRTLVSSSSGVSARLELGWSADGRMASCEVELQGRAEVELQPLIGHGRAEVVRQLVDQLGRRGGTVVLLGLAGVGKSTVLRHAIQQLKRSGHAVTTLRLNPGTTSRGLFLEVLASITGVELSVFLAAARRPDQLERILAQVGGASLSSQMREAVADVILARIDDYVSHRDLNDQLLIEYLAIAGAPRQSQPRVAVFEEINHAPRETVEFLHALGSQLAQAGLSVLYEVRETTSEESGARFGAEQLVKLLQQSRNCRLLQLANPHDEDARQWLIEQLPGFGPERAEIVRSRVGNRPLFLSAALDWMVSEGVVRSHDANHVLIEDLERFFEGISPPTCTAVLDRLISSFRRNSNERVRVSITALGLLDGELIPEVLEKICGDQPMLEFVESLLNTSLFAEGDRPGTVVSSHGLVLDRVRASTSQIEAARVAAQLLEWLDEIQVDAWTSRRWRVKLLAANGAWTSVIPEAREVARELARQRQWAQAIETHDLVLRGLQRQPWSVERERAIAETSVEILEAERQRYRLGTQECINLLESTRTVIELVGPGGGAEWRRVVLRAQLADWRSLLVREDLEGALERGRAVMAMALEESVNLGDELCGQAVCCLGVALKAIGRRQDSLVAFDRGIERFPSSLSAAAGRLSNLAASSLSADPERSLEFIEALLRLVEGRPYPFSDYLHARVDRSMMAFLCRRYDIARELAFDGIRLSRANAVPAQEARARNILGCCRWVAGDADAALVEFDHAAFASERSVSYRFLWRMRTNCALAALDAGKWDSARAFARSAVRMVVEPRRNVLERLAPGDGHEQSRWYVALLALGNCFYKLEDLSSLRYLYAAISEQEFEERLLRCVAEDWPAEVFDGTSHIHGGRIMLTG